MTHVTLAGGSSALDLLVLCLVVEIAVDKGDHLVLVGSQELVDLLEKVSVFRLAALVDNVLE